MEKSNYEQVKEFHNAFGHEMPDSPTPMGIDMVLNRMGFLAEEMIELIHATSKEQDDFRKNYFELLKRMTISFEKLFHKSIPEDVLAAQVDALIDIKYFNEGNFTLISVDPTEPFNIVHRANMGKLWHDNKPRYNEYGKFIKPPMWELEYAPEPKLKLEIQRQIEINK
ncbi:HAD family hydrolase [Paenibacillus xylaniclasticus]|uniref:HAD family hydrolase n=1 Tax=Paenibacillus xylaniclasticus TaxID=588083 RepID=UPI000FD72861|nr:MULTISPECIES: HAD family hydrolase [Paenibacillus]GFN32421.1 haloacid dehalogenase [Paenibacillus curdlanolyticus]